MDATSLKRAAWISIKETIVEVKPDKKKTSSLPTSLEQTTMAPEPQIQLPQRYDQPVNLTAGVKNISIASVDLGQGHTDNPADMSQHASSQQGLNYDSFSNNP